MALLTAQKEDVFGPIVTKTLTVAKPEYAPRLAIGENLMHKKCSAR